MDEQKAWIRSRRKRRLRITAVILSLCLLFTTYPDILEAVSVFAAEEAAPEAGDDNEEEIVEDGAGSAGQEDMEESDIGEADTVTEDEEEQDAQPEESEEEAVGTEETDETVQENGEDAAVQALLSQIGALPEAEEYLAKEPDIDNWNDDDDAYEEAYEEWMEGLSAYAEEALAIWEEYEALTQEQQAQIPEEALHKLTAWMELAEQAAGSRNVMAVAAHTCNGITFNDSLPNSLTSLSSGNTYNYYLTANRGTLTIPSGVTVNLCLNGYRISNSSSGNVITVESGATLNLYDCKGGGTVSSTYTKGGYGISASGTDTAVNLYGGTVSVVNSSGVKLEDGAHLLVDGAEVKSEFTKTPNGERAAVDISSGASAEIKFGRVSIENTAQSSKVAIIRVDGGSLTVSGGTVEGTGRSFCESIWIYWGTADNYEDSRIEINDGTIDANVTMQGKGNLVVNGTKINGSVILNGGVLKLQDGQSIGSARPENANITISRDRDAGNITGIIELTSPLADQVRYTLWLNELTSSSEYPFTVIKNFSTYMSGKDPTAYFTYLSSGNKEDHYKIILQENGEVVLMPYVMSFDANGGTLEDSTEYSHIITDGKGDITGYNYMRALPEPTRDGYDFDGWYTQKTGGTKVTLDDELYKSEKDVTVYAHWTPIDYSITYDLNGGAIPTGKTNPETYNIESANFTLNNPSRTGYTFTGWSGTGLTGNTNKTVTVKKGSMGERTYTANWGVANYTVTYNKNSGTIANENSYTSYTFGTGMTLPTPTRTGYTFGGWYTSSDFSGTAVTKITTTDMGNKTYYAKWTSVTYTITYTLNNGTVTGNPTSYTIESNDITLNNPTRTGYTFAGWSGTGLTGSSNKSVTISKGSTGNRSYTANWTADKYKITYNGLTNASLTTKPTQHTYGTATTVGNPTKTGYTFAGWKVNGSNTATTNLTLGATAYTADITLTATWTANTYTVTFDYQSATGGNSETNRTVTYDSTYGTVSGTSKSLPSPTRTGYTFKGWYTQTGGNGSEITDTTAVSITAAQTLYAYWKDETPPDVPVLQTGVTLPTGWTNTQNTIPLTLYDGVEVTELWVSVDGGDYTKVSGFPSNRTEYAYAAADGEHTYQFKARDAAGNESSASAAYKVMQDTNPPEIDLTEMSVVNGTKGLWNWIIGKKSMIIKIPASDITDAHSGIAEVTYTATPDSGTEQTGTIRAKGGYYEIALNAEFTGTIRLTAEDNAGNTTQASLTAEGGKVIAEDYAPVVTITLPDTPTPNENGWYTTGFAITVTVTDDKDSGSAAITSGGIAKITWKNGENGAEQTVSGLPGDAPVYEKEFTITAAEGTNTYHVKAVDNAGNESGWQTVTVSLDTVAPAFSVNPVVTDRTQESADIAFTPSEGGKAFWIVDAGAAPDAREVKNQSGQNGNEKGITGGTQGTFTVGGFQPGTTHKVYVVLEDAAGNLSEVKEVSFTTLQKAPDLTLTDLIIDYRKETGKLPDGMEELEVYTNPSDPEGSMIQTNEDGSRPIVPGQPVYIRYPAKTEDGETTPPSGSVKIDIPDRPVSQVKQAAVTDTTVTVTDPDDGEEYVLVKKGQTPDWSEANTTGEFTGLEPNTEYDLYVWKKATDYSFAASEPAKTEVRTFVTIKEPVITGDGKGKDGNTAPESDVPYAEAGGTVTFTGTYGEEYTPVIIVGGQEMNPGAVITWNEGSGKGGWEYTLAIPEDAKEAGITVEFRKRAITGIAVTPAALTIYADHTANESIDALTAYLKENSSVQATYDNKSKDAIQADYVTTDSFSVKEAVYSYTVTAGEKTEEITLTVDPVTAAPTPPEEITRVKRADGYTRKKRLHGFLHRSQSPTRETVIQRGQKTGQSHGGRMP